jgi:uncharacterized protein (DUF924 family)
MKTTLPAASEVLAFWFHETVPRQWWQRDDSFDRMIAARFGALHEAAAHCELHPWRATPSGRLAEIIVLDQFSRNLHRDQPRAFACDAQALALAQVAVAAGADQPCRRCNAPSCTCPTCTANPRHPSNCRDPVQPARHGGQPGLRTAPQGHHRPLRTLPHRNAILGRPSTAEKSPFCRRRARHSEAGAHP